MPLKGLSGQEWVLQPVRLALEVGFMQSVLPHRRSDDRFEFIDDLKMAMRLSVEQNPPEAFAVWEDAIGNAVAEFCLDPRFDEACASLGDMEARYMAAHYQKTLAYRKKRVRHCASEFDDFYFSVADEAWYQLMQVSLQRYILGNRPETFLERLYLAYATGGYPCGLKKTGKIVVFHPGLLLCE